MNHNNKNKRKMKVSEFIQAMFSRRSWARVPDFEKDHFMFPVRRIISKWHPELTEIVNYPRVSNVTVMNALAVEMQRIYRGKQPDWIWKYNPPKGSSSNKKSDYELAMKKYSKSAIGEFMRINNVGSRDMEFMFEMDKKGVMKELRVYENIK